jgi:hypothetical protein
MLPKHAKRFAKAMKAARASDPATLTVVATGARSATLTDGRALTETAVPCRGIVATWRKEMFQGTLVLATDRMIHLFGATLKGNVPKVGDRITIDGATGRIIATDRDGAAAVYLCLVRA